MCQAELYCCAGNSPSLCVHTQHPGKGKYHRIFGAPLVHFQHFALEAAVRAELLAGLQQYLHEVMREISSFRQPHRGFFSFTESNRFTHSSLMVMTQNQRKIHLQVVVCKTKWVWHEHSSMCTAASAHRTLLFIVYLLFNLFVPQSCLRALCTCQFNL